VGLSIENRIDLAAQLYAAVAAAVEMVEGPGGAEKAATHFILRSGKAVHNFKRQIAEGTAGTIRDLEEVSTPKKKGGEA
jgi:hypothetical protein